MSLPSIIMLKTWNLLAEGSALSESALSHTERSFGQCKIKQ